MKTHRSYAVSLGRRGASVIFLDCWHGLSFQMTHVGPNHSAPPVSFLLLFISLLFLCSCVSPAGFLFLYL